MLHHPHKTITALAGSLLLSLALGCQTPVATTVPKVAVSLGTLQWSSEADLAILLDFRPLLNMRKVQATTAVGPVATIEAKVTGENIVGEITAPVIQTSMCPGGVATINFANLPAGHVHVVVNAYDAAHNLITYGKGEADILPGEVKVVNVTCEPANSGLEVHFNCPGCDDPVPPPQPAPIPIPPALMSEVSGMTVDDAGNVYLLGQDPIGSPSPRSFDIGRTIKVGVDRTTGLLWDSQTISSNAVVRGTSIYISSFYAPEVVVNTTTFVGQVDLALKTQVHRWTEGECTQFRGITAVAFDNNGSLIGANYLLERGREYQMYRFDDPNSYFQSNFDNTCNPVSSRLLGYLYTDANLIPTDNFAFLSMIIDPTASVTRPIWTSPSGIVTLGSPVQASTGYPLNQAQRPSVLALPSTYPTAGSMALGIAPITGQVGKYLVSFSNDPKIYLWDEQNVSAPFVSVSGSDYTSGFTYKIAKGAGSTYYLLNVSGDVPTDNNGYHPTYASYTVVKTHLVGNSLVKDGVVATN